MSSLRKTFTIGGGLEVNRLGYGAMRLTGKGIWGEPKNAGIRPVENEQLGTFRQEKRAELERGR